MSSVSIRHSPVNFEDLTQKEYQELCEYAIKINPKYNIYLLAEIGTPQTKYYIYVTSSTDEFEYETPVIQAVKCPTIPETYLNIESKNQGRGNIAWICMTETGKIYAFKIQSYIMKPGSDISEGKTSEGESLFFLFLSLMITFSPFYSNGG